MNYWISGGIGAVVGSAAGYIVAKIRYEKKLAKEVEAKVNAILEEVRYKERTAKREKDTESTDDEKEGDRVTYDSVIEEYGASRDDYYSAKEVKVDPAERESPTEKEEYEDLSEMDPNEYEEKVANGEIITEENRGYIEMEELDREINSGRPPKLITGESYLNDYPNFDKTELAYYTGVNGEGACLIDIEADEELIDEAAFVGDCLDRFDFRNNGEQRIFVRNFNFATDYEIKKIVGEFEIF